MFEKLNLTAAALVLACAPATAQELRIGTASLGGAFYPMGQSIANLVNKYAGDEISLVPVVPVVPVVTGGSVQTPRLLATGEVEIANTNNNLVVLAVAGKGPYSSGPIDMSAVAALHPSVLHMIVPEGSVSRPSKTCAASARRSARLAVAPSAFSTSSRRCMI